LDQNTGDTGDAGDLAIATDRLTVRDGAQISAATATSGEGGNIVLDANQVILKDGASVTVNSQGTEKAGDIDIRAGSLTLDRNAILSAQTDSGQGGNITLNLQDLLLLRYNSQISTTAGTAQAGGDGGDITIDTGFIVAVPEENSDITANAYQGQGGNINITAQDIFGIEFREGLTPLSDITASSELGVDGVVEINRPDVDPSRGLAELPTALVDAQGLVDQSCNASGSLQQSTFTVTGRGGVPPSPRDSLSSDAVEVNWVTPPAREGNHSRTAISTNPRSIPTRIVEAQGWVKSPDGQVILVAHAPSTIPHNSWQTSSSCQSLQPHTN
jgi:large exoprotein involved in heme utilization and adhesion